MLKILNRDNINELEAYLNQEIYKGFSQEVFVESLADFHIIYEENGKALARCSVWFTNTPKGKNSDNIGCIGHFEAQCQEFANKVLEKACNTLRGNGCDFVVGPMDGNTWRRYRFVTYSDGSNPFLLEPQNSLKYPIWFEDFGFKQEAQYFSKRSKIQKPIQDNDKKILDLEKRGVKLKPLDMQSLDTQLDIIYDISAVSFSNNLYYTKLDRDSFKNQYYAYKDYLVSDLILIAFDEDEPVGFVFLIPDYNEMKSKGKVETVIAKTIAVLPDYRQIGLGNAMLSLAYSNAFKLGFEDVIVALVYSDNVSAKLIDRDFDYNRKYTLYSKDL
ncbi:MAG: GNAT family N-acetyltransferase [Acutalibacteraceae bacterium]|jgi:ribosomal protein S18 acetylase RimI-like enzyme|nr:GNAT family N-acetyltransferase [Clostridiales bacterium]